MSREDSLTLHRSHLVTLTIRILLKSSAHITDIIRKDLLGLWIQGYVHDHSVSYHLHLVKTGICIFHLLPGKSNRW